LNANKTRKPWNAFPFASLSVRKIRPDLSACATQVLQYLCARSNWKGETIVGQRRTAEDIHRSKQYVTVAMKELTAKKLIGTDPRARMTGQADLKIINPSILAAEYQEILSKALNHNPAEQDYELPTPDERDPRQQDFRNPSPDQRNPNQQDETLQNKPSSVPFGGSTSQTDNLNPKTSEQVSEQVSEEVSVRHSSNASPAKAGKNELQIPKPTSKLDVPELEARIADINFDSLEFPVPPTSKVAGSKSTAQNVGVGVSSLSYQHSPPQNPLPSPQTKFQVWMSKFDDKELWTHFNGWHPDSPHGRIKELVKSMTPTLGGSMLREELHWAEQVLEVLNGTVSAVDLLLWNRTHKKGKYILLGNRQLFTALTTGKQSLLTQYGTHNFEECKVCEKHKLISPARRRALWEEEADRKRQAEENQKAAEEVEPDALERAEAQRLQELARYNFDQPTEEQITKFKALCSHGWTKGSDPYCYGWQTRHVNATVHRFLAINQSHVCDNLRFKMRFEPFADSIDYVESLDIPYQSCAGCNDPYIDAGSEQGWCYSCKPHVGDLCEWGEYED
jgi:hypothetical protein